MAGEELVPCVEIGKKREDKESFSPVSLRKSTGVRLIISYLENHHLGS